MGTVVGVAVGVLATGVVDGDHVGGQKTSGIG